jgi:hypothetical protein
MLSGLSIRALREAPQRWRRQARPLASLLKNEKASSPLYWRRRGPSTRAQQEALPEVYTKLVMLITPRGPSRANLAARRSPRTLTANSWSRQCCFSPIKNAFLERDRRAGRKKLGGVGDQPLEPAQFKVEFLPKRWIAIGMCRRPTGRPSTAASMYRLCVSPPSPGRLRRVSTGILPRARMATRFSGAARSPRIPPRE